jgi:basic amino acid/polyamine antiporter, APA family
LKKLERSIELPAVIAISISAMLGSGIFVLPGIGIATTGPSIWLAYLLSALCILPAALSKSELATAMPTSGGTYVYVERTFGPFAGTVAGLGLFLSILLKSSFSLVGIAAYLSIFSDINPKYLSIGLLVMITILNLFGVGKMKNLITTFTWISITVLVGLGIWAAPTVDTQFLLPFTPQGPDGLFAATGLVFISFAGVTKVAAIAEEIKDPGKNLPLGILISLFIVTLLYVFISFILVTNSPFQDLQGNLKPVYDLALKLGGPISGGFFAIMAILTMTSESNAGVLAGSRFPFAMARDRLLPTRLGKLHRKLLTPIWSINLSAVIIVTVILTQDVVKIAKLASAFMIMIYMVENIAVIVLRETRVQWYKPSYKSPLYPGIQIFGIISSIWLLFEMGQIVWVAIVTVSVPGVLLYVFYSRTRTTRKGVIGIKGPRADLKQESSVAASTIPTSFSTSQDLNLDANVVVSLFGKERSPEMLIEMGIALAEHGNVEVAHLTEVPEQTDLNDILEEPAYLKSLRRRIIAMAVEKKEPITFDPVVTHDMTKTVFEISQRFHCQWLLMEWGGKTRGTFTLNNPIGWLKNHLKCNLAIFRDTGVRYIRKIAVHMQGDQNDPLILDTAIHLAEVNRGDIILVEWFPIEATKEQIDTERLRLEEMASNCPVKFEVRTLQGSKRKVDALVGVSVEFDLLILGSSPHSFIQNLTGSFEDKIIARSACSVISVLNWSS